ncbi:MAG: hypothetical protein JKY37_19610 [Nannocystaceae bacterium]|nr:hypothetical protein [Nannocystaceae bacterium]
MRRPQVGAAATLLTLLTALAACRPDPIELQGQFGRSIALATGDASPLPRLAFIDEGCPGSVAAGGCSPDSGRACEFLLIDSLAPITALKDPDALLGTIGTECLEVRSAGGLASDPAATEDLEAAVARFRFNEVPAIRAPSDGTDDWNWLAGDGSHTVDPAGVLGGNLLRSLAVRMRVPRRGRPTVTFYSEFPGTEENLADAGRTYLPVQFPGRLLGRELPDRCELDGDRCELGGLAFTPGRDNLALQPTRMVLDACVAMPPCTVRYERDRLDPFTPGECTVARGPELKGSCVRASEPEGGGETASLVLASGVPGMVLFADSVVRMFGPPEALPACTVAAVNAGTRACPVGIDGVLHVSGWPSAGEDEPLVRLRVRSVGLVPGVVDTRDVTPCERADVRRNAALEQCVRFVEAAEAAGDVRNTFPPFSALADADDGEGHNDDPAASSLVTLGEASFPLGAEDPNPERWIDVTVLPETHPLVTALRRDVSPEAVQPDGLLGTVLFDDTETVLDYTDPNPGVRLSCLDPRSGDCFAAPDCRTDGQPACCFGMPLELVVDWIVIGEDDTCCGALSAGELSEVKNLGRCLGVSPP